MAKGNLFLGTGKGKIGDVVLYRANGGQRSRIKVKPADPRTVQQMAQRITFRTVAKSFNFLSNICDHSFAGIKYGADSYNEFLRLNVPRLRARWASSINVDAVATSKAVHFMAKDDIAPVNPLVISSGALTPVTWTWDSAEFHTFAASNNSSTPTTITAGDLARMFGTAVGDQLTFVVACALTQNPIAVEAPLFSSTRVGRIIPPAGATEDTVLFLGTAGDDGAFTFTPPSNSGVFVENLELTSAPNNAGFVVLKVSDVTSSESIVAAAVIASRLSSGVWQRSTEALTYITDLIPDGMTLGRALESYEEGILSSWLLNKSRQ